MIGVCRQGGRAFLWWGLWLLWCVLIFLITAEPVFTGESTAQALQQAASSLVAVQPTLLMILNVLLRKFGHVLGYGVLGILSCKALGCWPGLRRPGMWAWLLSTVYAATDEWHQTMVPGRTGHPLDVLLDSAGAAMGIWVLWRGRLRLHRSQRLVH